MSVPVEYEYFGGCTFGAVLPCINKYLSGFWDDLNTFLFGESLNS